jgi:Alanine-zipper, major outer membrane lipoprotein
MAASRKDLDAELERLYRQPLGEFTKARNDLAKQLRKLGSPKEADYVRTLPKPTPSAWAVNQLFEREPAGMDTLLAAGQRARAGQREAVSGRGAAALRESLQAARGVMDDLRQRAAEILRASGGSESRALLERIATDLQALAFSPAAADAASRRWLSRDLDPPGFEVLAGLQLAGAPVVDLAARRAKPAERQEPARRQASKVPPSPNQPDRDAAREAREARERQRKEAAERLRREREEERVRRRVEAAQETVNRARGEAEALRQHAEKAVKTAADARRQADAAEVAARREREKADRAAERLARAQEELQEARGDAR